VLQPIIGSQQPFSGPQRFPTLLLLKSGVCTHHLKPALPIFNLKSAIYSRMLTPYFCILLIYNLI
jgi:hypothetical protein